jgi:outer membrane protein
MKATIKTLLFLLPITFLCACNSGKSSGEESNGNDADTLKKKPPVRIDDGSGMRIAYINNDSLIKKYSRYESIMKEAEEKQLEAEKRLMALEQEFMRFYQELEQKAPLMTKSELEKAEKEIERRKLNLDKEKMRLSNELAQYQNNILTAHLETITKIAKAYAEENGFDYVFTYQPGGQMLYGNNAYDITDEIVKRLNADFNTLLGE